MGGVIRKMLHAVALAGRILADLGADVVRAELPGTDVTQAFGKVTRGRSGLYSHVNVGKRSILRAIPGERVGGTSGMVINLVLLGLLLAGFTLSLATSRRASLAPR